ncbi:MAG: peptidoglycan DD-metalloendopeptidase family protein [Rhodocyclaceae bacterium]|nr:peptidoglycan DD-metalloendopeptidase family protein [Rhodocyclaceae bacterium]
MSCGSIHRALVVLSVVLAIVGCAAPAPAPVAQRPPPPAEASAQRAPSATAPARIDTSPGSAPVSERDTRPEVHVVRKGDTLVSISLEYGLDYRDVATWNRIENINLIRIGQTLRLRAPGDAGPSVPAAGAVARPVEVRPRGGLPKPVPLADPEGVRTEPRALRQPFSERALAEAIAAGRRPGEAAVARTEPTAVTGPEPILPPRPEVAVDPVAINWAWPASGTVIERFSDTNRGIDIGGKAGQPILASADGRVVYSGSAIRGYGRMLIVKHNDLYVSVYAHAAELLVKEGQAVSRGQRIAEMGSTDADRVKLHFEIRRMGRPVDPLRYLSGEGAS